MKNVNMLILNIIKCILINVNNMRVRNTYYTKEYIFLNRETNFYNNAEIEYLYIYLL